jgi:hypothetical protein
MYEILASIFTGLLDTLVMVRDPWGIVSCLFILFGFGVAFVCADAGNWTAAWIFAAVGTLGFVGLIFKKISKSNS